MRLLRQLGGRFRKPVLPGTHVTLHSVAQADGVLRFVVRTADGATAIDDGMAVLGTTRG